MPTFSAMLGVISNNIGLVSSVAGGTINNTASGFIAISGSISNADTAINNGVINPNQNRKRPSFARRVRFATSQGSQGNEGRRNHVVA